MKSDDKFFQSARDEMFPKMRGAAFSIVLAGDPDPKLCMELGAAILFDKPIIAMVPAGRKLPANLARVASAVVQGDIRDDVTKQRLQEAISRVLSNDKRVTQ